MSAIAIDRKRVFLEDKSVVMLEEIKVRHHVLVSGLNSRWTNKVKRGVDKSGQKERTVFITGLDSYTFQVVILLDLLQR